MFVTTNSGGQAPAVSKVDSKIGRRESVMPVKRLTGSYDNNRLGAGAVLDGS